MNRKFSLLIAAPLVLSLGACSLFSPPKDLDIRSTRESTGGKYVVSMQPLAQPVQVNKIHSWEIKVTSSSGDPVKNALIAFDGGMPQHFHSFPTKPRVTEGLGDGRYRLDGVKFSMPGWWEMKAKIQSDLGSDQVTVNVVMTESGIATSQQAK